jgi:hypothetical protein
MTNGETALELSAELEPITFNLEASLLARELGNIEAEHNGMPLLEEDIPVPGKPINRISEDVLRSLENRPPSEQLRGVLATSYTDNTAYEAFHAAILGPELGPVLTFTAVEPSKNECVINTGSIVSVAPAGNPEKALYLVPDGDDWQILAFREEGQQAFVSLQQVTVLEDGDRRSVTFGVHQDLSQDIQQFSINRGETVTSSIHGSGAAALKLWWRQDQGELYVKNCSADRDMIITQPKIDKR